MHVLQQCAFFLFPTLSALRFVDHFLQHTQVRCSATYILVGCIEPLILHLNVAGIPVQLLEGLCQQSEEARSRWARLLKSQQRMVAGNNFDDSAQSDGVAPLVASRSATKIEFLQGSFLDFEGCRDWSDADVVLANSVCFSASMMMDLSRLGERLRPGAFFITSNTRLGSFLCRSSE